MIKHRNNVKTNIKSLPCACSFLKVSHVLKKKIFFPHVLTFINVMLTSMGLHSMTFK